MKISKKISILFGIAAVIPFSGMAICDRGDLVNGECKCRPSDQIIPELMNVKKDDKPGVVVAYQNAGKTECICPDGYQFYNSLEADSSDPNGKPKINYYCTPN